MLIKVKAIFVILLTMFVINSYANNVYKYNGQKYRSNENGQVIAWIFFKDKGPQETLSKVAFHSLISERALERRKKVKSQNELIDFSDYKLYQPYLDQVQNYAQKIRTKSNWLNAVSVIIDSKNLGIIEALDFVEKIQPVFSAQKRKPFEEQKIEKPNTLQKTAALDYGSSLTQLSQINVPAMHEKGLYGQSVLICLLDDGFNLLNHHETFDSLDVYATWDFIHNDESVDDSEYSATEGTHGTKTLSAIAGYTPGTLIGSAFKATYILGKTEVDSYEKPVEEDYWVAGIEWADSLGADLVSSSLGYLDWYDPEDMDGETAVTTIAADLAVEKGIVVFNSAGNEYDNETHNTLIAPADGDNVMAIAAVTSDGSRSYFSSVGPSADGRIKPDVAAMGSSVTVASSNTDDGYVSSNGTSFSCPLAAGAAALILQDYPEITPGQLNHALRSTASQNQNPDKYLGWGIMDVFAAYEYIDTSGLENLHDDVFPNRIDLQPNYPNPINPFNPSTTIRYVIKNSGNVTINIYNSTGQLIETIGPYYRSGGGFVQSQVINLVNNASGIYFYHIKLKEAGSGKTYSKAGKMMLLK